MMKWGKIGIPAVIAALMLIISVTAMLNADGLAEKKDAQENALVRFHQEGGEAVVMDLDAVKSVGTEDFEAEIRSSSRPSSEHIFSGVPLSALLAAANIDLDAKQQVIVRSVDGFVVALTGEEVLMEENIYLIFAQDGEGLGTRDEGGSGPYQLLIRQDPFSQRWAKFVTDVEVR